MLGALVVLVFLSAFFSGTETGMMALNRYRLRHLARQGHRSARRVEKMLQRPDRLLGVILIGNNFINNYVATIAAILALAWFGNTGAALAPVIITIIMLIFAEVTPKTYAAVKPESVALPASLILQPLMWLLWPLVWFVGTLSNALLRIGGINPGEQAEDDHLSPEELRTVVNEAGGLIPKKHQRMLLNILDLETVTVDDIMIPRSEMVVLDIDDDLPDILNILRAAQHTRLPICRQGPDNIIGILHLRKVNRLLMRDELTRADILQVSVEPYFVPEGTPLHTQLINFQNVRRRLGIVVDEYGDVQGLITLEDILEEIVGEFTTDLTRTMSDIHPQNDGSYLIDGMANLREINRSLHWQLPTNGPKTLNGLILEHFRDIPENNTSFKIGDYVFEILQVGDTMVKTARLRKAGDGAETKDGHTD